jgi:hypothetical protein
MITEYICLANKSITSDGFRFRLPFERELGAAASMNFNMWKYHKVVILNSNI